MNNLSSIRGRWSVKDKLDWDRLKLFCCCCASGGSDEKRALLVYWSEQIVYNLRNELTSSVFKVGYALGSFAAMADSRIANAFRNSPDLPEVAKLIGRTIRCSNVLMFSRCSPFKPDVYWRLLSAMNDQTIRYAFEPSLEFVGGIEPGASFEICFLGASVDGSRT